MKADAYQVAIDFLERLRPGGPWLLIAIDPTKEESDEGQIEAETVRDANGIRNFIASRIGRFNLYYSLNPTRTAMRKKPAKKDIAAIEYLLADLDPKKGESSAAGQARYLEALKTFEPTPSAIVNSGNGLNVLWKLAEPIVLGEPIQNEKKKWVFSKEDQAQINTVEARSKAIMLALDLVAGTQNIDRILRLPGTINLPTPAKLKEGKVECPTSLVSFDGGEYVLDVFPSPAAKTKAKSKEQTQSGDRKPLPQILETLLKAPDSGAHEKCGGYEDRSAALAGFIRNAFNAGIDVEDIIKNLNDEKYKGCGIYEHCAENGKGDVEKYIRGQIEKVLADDEPATSGDKKKKAIGLPIRIRGGDRQDITDRLQKGLLKAKCPVYVRGGWLVEPLWRWEKTAEENRNTLVTKFLPLNEARLAYMVSKHVTDFQKWNVKSKRWAFTNPPKDSIEQLLELGHWSFETVKGISNSPIMRSDGSLFDGPGYDPRTQLWYKPPADLDIPTIPKRPSRKQAQDALGLLRELLAGFPFTKDDEGRAISESVAIAGLMTPVLRGAFDHTPGFLFLAPESGTGKTYLVAVIATIATGRVPMAIAGCENKEEMEKRLSAAAFGAMPILHLNNLSFNLESDLLNQMITEGEVGIRAFGQNKEITTCDCRGTTVFANGNNIAIVGDLVRRTLTAHLDAQMEVPEERTWDFDPVEKVKADRGKYLAAIFTIARAYMEAGCPEREAKALSGFTGWSKMVRQPLIWLGLPDPVVSMKEARALDPKRQVAAAAVNSLLDIFEDQNFSAAEVHAKGQEQIPVQPTTMGSVVQYQPKYPELRDVFFEGKNTSARSIGKLLGGFLNKRVGAHHIERLPTTDTSHAFTYRIAGPKRSM